MVSPELVCPRNSCPRNSSPELASRVRYGVPGTRIFVLVLAVPHAAEARRLARLFRAQQEWTELMGRHEEGKKDITGIDRL